jgi:Mrp family chromosome partitioning ATPase
MVNTRILEQRLGWRSTEEGAEPTPPTRAIGHAPMLQGRINGARRSAPSAQRRAEVEDIWASLPLILDSVDHLTTKGKTPSFARGTASGTAMDQLRTQLMRVIADKGWKRIGISSPSRGAGRSFVAAGLAASIARLETARVLLIDADLEEPGLHALLGLTPAGPLESLLAGTTEPEDQLQRIGSSLAVALNSAAVRQGSERMMAPEAILALRAMIDCIAPDVVIHDLPPLLSDPVTPALLPQLDAVLLVADGLRTTPADILESERLLEGLVPLLGVVLNKSEDRDPRAARRRS